MSKFNFGENLRNIRVVKGISQEVMAQKLDMSQRSYGRIEQNLKNPTYIEVCEMAKVFGVEAGSLMPPMDPNDPLYVPPFKKAVGKKPTPFLNTTLGNIFIIGSSMAILGGVHDYTWGICDHYKLSDSTTAYIRWTAVLLTLAFIVYSVRKIKKEIKEREKG